MSAHCKVYLVRNGIPTLILEKDASFLTKSIKKLIDGNREVEKFYAHNYQFGSGMSVSLDIGYNSLNRVDFSYIKNIILHILSLSENKGYYVSKLPLYVIDASRYSSDDLSKHKLQTQFIIQIAKKD